MKFNFDFLCITSIIILGVVIIVLKIFNVKGRYFDISENIERIKNPQNILSKISVTKAISNKFVSRGEEICRNVLEDIFKTEFPNSRPDFLKNPLGTKMNLEIDCYSSKLKLGLEYNGKQHYEYTSRFHKNKEAFQNQQYRDVLKKKLCEEHGVKLITISYKTSLQDIEKEIIEKLKQY